MKRNILILVLSLGLVMAATAAGQPANVKGSKAIDFSVSGLVSNAVVSGDTALLPSSTLSSGAVVYGIGGKYYLMDKLGLGLSMYISNSSYSNIDSSGFAIRPFVQYALFQKGPVEFNVGGYFNYGITDKKTTISATESEDDRESIWGLGATAGVEYFVADGISLGAEYAIGYASYGTASTYVDGASSITTSSSASYFGTMPASQLTINVRIYF